MRTVRLIADVITDRLPMKGAGDVVTVDDAFADHLLSIGAAIELKVVSMEPREPVSIEKKTPLPASPAGQVSPEPIARKRGRPRKL